MYIKIVKTAEASPIFSHFALLVSGGDVGVLIQTTLPVDSIRLFHGYKSISCLCCAAAASLLLAAVAHYCIYYLSSLASLLARG